MKSDCHGRTSPLWKLTYPGTGKVITYTPGAGGRPLQAKDVGGGINYVLNALYAPFGGLTSMTQGTTPITVSNSYNKRLQPITLSASTPSATLFSLSYDFHLGAGDNGNTFQMVNNRDSSSRPVGTVAFTYNVLNQIATAQTSGTDCTVMQNGLTKNWGNSYQIDPWGNLTGKTVTKCSAENLTAASNNKNQINGYCYDAAGNLLGPTACPNTTYSYDAENRLTGTAGWTYTYDGDGKRVKKTNGSAGTLYFTGTGSDPIAENSLAGTNLEEYIFFNGRRVARRDVSGSVVHYYFSDHLDSASVVANATGATIEDESDYYSFGGERPITTGDSNNYKFTGKERDAESGLDNFGKRYDASSLGRFMTTDPVVITTERLKNPQQLNLYAYVANNPLRFIDPTGEILQCAGNADQQKQCFADLQQVAGDAANRLSMDAKTGVVSFDTSGFDLSKNAGAGLVNDLVGSKNTYDFSIGPTVMTDKGPVKIDYITANLPTFGDQPKGGNPPPGVSDIVALYFNNPKVTRASNTNLKVAPEWTVAFHELAEAYEKIDGGKGESYAAGHNAALQRELELRDQRPYLKEYNTGAGGPANSPNPEGKIIIKQ